MYIHLIIKPDLAHESSFHSICAYKTSHLFSVLMSGIKYLYGDVFAL